MSFRFQKRVRVAPGVRLNFSKRGISTSVGRRGASVTMGRRGLYGNAGLPGTGMSYRTKLDKNGKRRVTQSNTNRGSHTQPVELIWDEELHDVRFEKSDGKPLTEQEERKVRREYKNYLLDIYKEKETEINSQTERLLDLHHNLFQPMESLEKAARISPDPLLNKPDEDDIYQKLHDAEKSKLTFFQKFILLFPANRKAFKEKIQKLAENNFEEALREYNEEIESLQQETDFRLDLAKKVKEGLPEAMEEWVSLFLDELDFPLETDVDFKISSSTCALADINLPKLEEVPLQEARLLKSGKLKVENKTHRDHREHYALMAGGTAFYLASFFFAYLPPLQTITISGYNQIVDPATGHEEDQYIYSLKIDRETLYSLKMKKVHPILAFDNFEKRLNATKTYIFKEIKPFTSV
ncbi:DUF4236 domain-containing protein [Salipaludibacillus sp. CUR1]|uniref:DUF4236 domain-containing protein n=1 Tax=Salipaludibacillus sp. CUR1 TaxID=2820003 RepID=UPI001E2F8331|nr:DUF4236 domain-containing protein [Salipaludibacillus sp. CUR1]MCE7794373.1 DUF4236 domain-containing protein [Salipaludibacillus sp. CUR1]